MKFFTESDVIEHQIHCRPCGKLVCYNTMKWMIPQELRFEDYGSADIGAEFGYRCNDCFSKWDCVSDEDISDEDFDENDITTIMHNLSCDYCEIHCGFFLEKILTDADYEKEVELDEKEKRELKEYEEHMLKIKQECGDIPHFSINKIICKNCRNQIN
jgi:hypothetical protein